MIKLRNWVRFLTFLVVELLKTAGATSVLAASGIAFPALTGFAKEFKGVTLQGASFSSTFFKYLENYFPEFEEQTGMKVNFVTNAFQYSIRERT